MSFLKALGVLTLVALDAAASAQEQKVVEVITTTRTRNAYGREVVTTTVNTGAIAPVQSTGNGAADRVIGQIDAMRASTNSRFSIKKLDEADECVTTYLTTGNSAYLSRASECVNRARSTAHYAY